MSVKDFIVAITSAPLSLTICWTIEPSLVSDNTSVGIFCVCSITCLEVSLASVEILVLASICSRTDVLLLFIVETASLSLALLLFLNAPVAVDTTALPTLAVPIAAPATLAAPTAPGV